MRVWSDVILKGCPIAAGRGRLPTAHVSARIPRWFYPCYSLSSDDRMTCCWSSSEQYSLLPWRPGDGQATYPSALAALAKAETSPLGCRVVISMEMRRKAGHDSGSHLPGQRLGISEEPFLPNSNLVQVAISPNSRPKPSLPLSLLSSLEPEREQRQTTVHLSLSWQCYCSEACWEQWWDVRLDPQVRAGPVRGCTAEGLPTLLRFCCGFFIQECESSIPKSTFLSEPNAIGCRKNTKSHCATLRSTDNLRYNTLYDWWCLTDRRTYFQMKMQSHISNYIDF